MAKSQVGIDTITAPGYYRVAPNLYLQIRPHGSRSWLFRYQRGGADLGEDPDPGSDQRAIVLAAVKDKPTEGAQMRVLDRRCAR